MGFLKTMALGAIVDVDVTKAVTNVKGLSGVLKTAAKGFTTLGSGISSAGRTLLKVGAVGVGVTAGLGLMASSAASFEQQMAKVQSVMLDTEGKAIPALKKRAEELALATTFSATQVGEGMELMARAGFSTGQIIEGIGGVLAVAASEGIDLAEASGIVSATLKGMGLEADQAGRVADVLAVAATSTKSSISTLGIAMANASTTAKTFGLSLEDTVASVALMQDVGIDAAESGTALKTMLLRLAKPSDTVKEKMNKLGLQIQDAHGNMLPFQQVVGNLSKVLPKLGGNIDQAAFLTDLFGLRGIKAGVALADAFSRPDSNLSGLISKLQDANGAAEDMANLKLDNLSDQIGLVGSSMEVLSSRIFGPFLPLVKEGVKDLVKLLNEVAAGLSGEGTSSAAMFGKGMADALVMVKDAAVATRDTLRDIAISVGDSLGGETARALGVAAVAAIALVVALTPVALVVGTILVALGGLITTVGLVIGAFAALGAPAILATLAVALVPVQLAIAALPPLIMGAVAAFAFMRANGGSLGGFLSQTFARVQRAWSVFSNIFMGSWGEIKAAFLPAMVILRSAFGDLMATFKMDSDQTNKRVVNIATTLAEVAVFAAKLAAGFALWGAVAVKAGAMVFKLVGRPLFEMLEGGITLVTRLAAKLAVGFGDASKASSKWIMTTAAQLVTFADSVDKAVAGMLNSIIAAMIKVTDFMVKVAGSPLAQFAMRQAGIDPAQAIATLTKARGALAAAKVEPIGVATKVRDVQARLKETLEREARSRASATSPEVNADVTLEDKRRICLENNLNVDGRDFAIANKEAEVELTERAGFSVTPWQKRQILERGATVLNPS